jgi:hypothetical protein
VFCAGKFSATCESATELLSARDAGGETQLTCGPLLGHSRYGFAYLFSPCTLVAQGSDLECDVQTQQTPPGIQILTRRRMVSLRTASCS